MLASPWPFVVSLLGLVIGGSESRASLGLRGLCISSGSFCLIDCNVSDAKGNRFLYSGFHCLGAYKLSITYRCRNKSSVPYGATYQTEQEFKTYQPCLSVERAMPLTSLEGKNSERNLRESLVCYRSHRMYVGFIERSYSSHRILYLGSIKQA